MTDSEEESVDSHIIVGLISLTLTLYYVHTFHTVFSIQSGSVMFKENLNILGFHHTLLHDLRGAQERLAYHEVYLLAQS